MAELNTRDERAGKLSGVTLILFSVCVAYIVALATMLVEHLWLWKLNDLAALDFVDVYAAGKLALAHHARDVYDWPIHRLAESQALMRAVTWKEYFGWHYPPPFLFAAALMATLPYLWAFFAWNIATLIPYMIVVRRVAGSKAAWLAAFAFPAAFFNIAVGQNGFVTALLIGGSLMCLGTRPILSGIFLGLLAFKPQFGILFPIALAAGGYWRTLAAATAVVGLMVISSGLAFGLETWLAFFHSITTTVDAVFVRGMAGWAKLATVYGFSRWIGVQAGWAAALQAATTAALIVAVIVQWRSKAAFHLKAAGLIAASLLATPYLYVYDLPVAAVALAFLFRARQFDGTEICAIALMAAAIAIFPLVLAPTGLAATLLLMAMIVRRTAAAALMIAAH